MYLNNVGIRKIALFIGCSPALVVYWIKQFAHRLSDRLKEASEVVKDDMPDIIELDELYTYVKKSQTEQSYGLLILEGRSVLLRM